MRGSCTGENEGLLEERGWIDVGRPFMFILTLSIDTEFSPECVSVITTEI